MNDHTQPGAESSAPDLDLDKLEAAVMGQVLSPTGMRLYLNGDPLELKPSTLRDIVRLTALARRATAPHAAPEQEKSMENSNARFAIGAAIQFGRENRNPPPNTDHWLYEYWNIGRQLAALGATGWDNITPMPAGSALVAVKDEQHPDDLAVDRFAAAMKEKMAKSRAKGRGGWDNPEQCSVEFLQSLLLGHLAKGDPVDIGNFAMMLWNRGESTAAESAAAPAELPDGWKATIDEVERATRKFPTWPTDPLHAVAVLGEEFGELTKAVLQTTYEPHKVKDGELRTEAIQTAAMALRFLASLDRYEFAQCPQHKQAATQQPSPTGEGHASS